MSEISVQLLEAMKLLEVNADGITYENREAALTEINHHDAFQSHSFHESVRALRPVVRRYGGVSWENADEAMEAVTADCVQACMDPMFRALAEGVLLGRSPSPVIKKYELMDKMDDIFESEGFQTEVSIQALRLMDADTRAALQRFALNSAYMIGSMSGFGSSAHGAALMIASGHGSHISDVNEIGPQRIFDVWVMASNMMCLTLFAIGQKLGRRWELDAELEGIVNASQESS